MRNDVDKILAEKNVSSMLLYSESFKDVNMYYLTGFLAPDPFVFLKNVGQKPLIVVGQMELARAKKESFIKDVRSFSDYDYTRIVKSASDPRIGVMKFIASLAKKELETDESIYVPPNLPVILADVLRHSGLQIKPMLHVVEKARETKEHEEI